MQSTQKPIINNSNIPFRTAYSPRLRISLSCPEQGRTKQSFKDECDINQIMARYMQTGVLPDLLNPKTPQYIDATGFDFDVAMNLVAEATSAFAQLPANIRADFDHDPGAFLDFVSKPENGPKLVEMGLASRVPDWAGGGTTATPPTSPQSPNNPSQIDSPSTTGSSGASVDSPANPSAPR